MEIARKILDELPWADLRSTYVNLVNIGQKPNQAASAVASVADKLIDWREVVKGPAGQVLEAVDELAVRLLVLLGVRLALRFSSIGV
ncbi:MAG: hypothetical protein ABMA64_07055 [Myxococcota bacterium]